MIVKVALEIFSVSMVLALPPLFLPRHVLLSSSSSSWMISSHCSPHTLRGNWSSRDLGNGLSASWSLDQFEQHWMCWGLSVCGVPCVCACVRTSVCVHVRVRVCVCVCVYEKDNVQSRLSLE